MTGELPVALDGALREGSAARIIEIATQSWADGVLVRDSSPDATSPQFTILAAAIAGEMALVERWNDRGMEITASREDAVGRSFGALWRSVVSEANGHPAAAVVEGREVGSGDITIFLPMQVALLGASTLLTEGPAAAARALDQLPKSARDPQLLTSSIWHLARAGVALTDDRPHDALEDLREVEAGQRVWPVPAGGWSMWEPLAVEAHLALGDVTRANVLAEVGVEGARAFGAPRPLARALRGAALTLPLEERVPLLQEAFQVTSRGRCGLDGALIRVELGLAAAAVDDDAAAAHHFQSVLDAADRTGAHALGATAFELATELGVRVERSTSRPGLLDLTPAQRRVVELAVQDRPNRAIAQALFLSEKTVEAHLTAAYRTLGIHGRDDLAAAVEEGRS